TADRPPPRTTGSLAYIIYPSGSTGRPKGVGVLQQVLVPHLQAAAGRYGLQPGDRFCHFVSPSFDTSLEEILTPLVTGGAVVVHGSDLWEPGEILARAAALRLTVLNLPTALWTRWVREHGREPLPEGLRLVLVGGGAMPASPAPLCPAPPLARAALLTGYGPTEAVITAPWWEVEPAGMAALAAGSAPIGWPLAGHTVHLLDAAGELVPR